MITTLIIIYLVSVIGAYKSIQKYATHYNVIGFVVMVTPILNNIVFLLGIIGWLTDNIDWYKFFNKF